MKRKMISFFTVVCLLLFSVFGFACQTGNAEKTKATVLAGDGQCVIYCQQSNETDKLMDVMEALREKGELQFEASGGMVTGIFGVENAADFNPCWMLYTTDAELSNTEWGVVEYDGKTLGSASVGAESLPVKTGEYYVWVYQSF